MTPEIDSRLIAIFSTIGWRRFMRTLASLRNRGKPFGASFSLPDSTEEERRGYSRLLQLKRPPEGPALRYDLRRIDAALTSQGLAVHWMELVNAICGPPPREFLLAQENRRRWEEFWQWAEVNVMLESFPHAHSWLQSLRKDGLLLRTTKGDPYVAREWYSLACKVLSQLPLQGEPLPSLAARLCGKSHALDPDTSLSSLVLRNLAMQQGAPVPVRSEQRRRLWEEFGVICDDLSAPVLTFNLGLEGSSWLCRLIATAAEESQPLHLTNRMVATTDWSVIRCPRQVFVCENPTIIALASSRLGLACPSMICVDGEPRSTSRSLLRHLRQEGASLWYHGDFDWPGMAIASRLISEIGALPWLLSASDYENAVSLGRHRVLAGEPVKTPWFPQLSDAMIGHGKAVDEEAVADLLIESLVKTERPPHR